jgi:hypothetical protein
MNKLLEAEDILAGARHCVECVFMAAASLSSREETDPLQAVADIASTKIEEAIALLSEYRESVDAGPVPAAPAAKPVRPAVARTKRSGK